jgi:hypothetical protein
MGITEDVDLQVAIGGYIETVRTLVNEEQEPVYGTVRRVHGIGTPRCGSLQQLRSNGIGGVRRADAGQKVVAREDEGGQQCFEIRATRECISNDIVSTSLVGYVKVEVHEDLGPTLLSAGELALLVETLQGDVVSEDLHRVSCALQVVPPSAEGLHYGIQFLLMHRPDALLRGIKLLRKECKGLQSPSKVLLQHRTDGKVRRVSVRYIRNQMNCSTVSDGQTG